MKLADAAPWPFGQNFPGVLIPGLPDTGAISLTAFLSLLGFIQPNQTASIHTDGSVWVDDPADTFGPRRIRRFPRSRI